jgi:hypothetical protein
VSVRPHVNLLEGVSILGWLGIAGQTHWDLLTNRDMKETVDLLGELSSHFLAAVSKIESSFQHGRMAR